MKNREDFKDFENAFLTQNSHLNLISKNDEKFLWEKHIFDSLAIEKFFEKYNIDAKRHRGKEAKQDNSYASSEFADGRSETSSDSEEIEPTVPKALRRNFPSVEQIQDMHPSFYASNENSPTIQPYEINPSTDNNFPLSTFRFQLLDIGTGGGFPAVPIAINYPEIEVYALDSIRKKINAIENIKAELDLKNLHTICNRAENLVIDAKRHRGKEAKQDNSYASSEFADGRSETSSDSEEIEPTVPKALRRNFPSVEQIQDMHQSVYTSNKNHSTDNNFQFSTFNFQFDIITSRAVAPIKVIAEYALPLLKNDGYFIAYKSIKAQEEIDDAKPILKKLNAKVIDIIKYKLPLEENFTRNLVVIAKN